MDITKGRQLLPKNARPRHYDLTLEPDFDKFTYKGTVVIDLDIEHDSNSISLNTKDIEIHETKFIVDGAHLETTPTTSYNEDSETTSVEIGAMLKKGQKAQMTQRFTGKLNDYMAGFYRSSWKDNDGKEHWLAATQMEPTGARRAFPCLDEPALKATFTVTLIADHDMTCLGNMDVATETEVASEITGKKRKAVTFNKTPLMSTYLVAFIVGQFKVYETNKFRIPIRVFCTPDQNVDHCVYPAELAARALELYEREFDIKLPLPKVDMVGLPDFLAGAMENWGLITYRAVYVLLDDKTASASDRHNVADTVFHELGHFWFGDYVTMEWWEGLWLKEGFATWLAWRVTNEFYPEWKVWDQFVTSTLKSALSLDGLRSSHPIEVPVKRADEVDQIFDDISYSKGCAVIRMISKYLGEDVFMDGIRLYLKRHAWGNTETGDLWAALSEASGKDVEKIAAIWTRKVGYPVITVTEDEKNGSIHLKQNRFIRTGDVKPEEDEVLYPVFLGLRTKDGVQEDLTLDTREASFKVSDMDFFKLNADHSGIYRTAYSPERLAKLGESAQAGLLTVADRAGMIADAGALAQAGYQSTGGLLNLLMAFKQEPDYQVWDEILSRLQNLRGAFVMEDEATDLAMKALIRDLVSEKAHQLGWTFGPTDGQIEQQFKALMFNAARESGDEKAIAASLNMFKAFRAGDRDAIHDNIRRGVLYTVIYHGGEAEYNAMQEEYEKATTANEKRPALAALGVSRDPKLIQRTLDYALSKEVKSQDIFVAIADLMKHKPGIEALWAWMTTNWDTLTEKFPASLGMLGGLVQSSVASFSKEEHVRMAEKFFEGKDTKGFDMNLAQALDVVKVKAGWLKRDKETVEQWLKEHGYLK